MAPVLERARDCAFRQRQRERADAPRVQCSYADGRCSSRICVAMPFL